MTFTIHQSGKRPRVRCVYCQALCDARTKRQQKYGLVCGECRSVTVAEICEHYQKQVDAGVPNGERWVLYPTCFPQMDAAFDRMIREALALVDDQPKRRRLVAV